MKKVPGRKQVGATVNEDLWRRLRALAVQEDRNTGELLDLAIQKLLDEYQGERRQEDIGRDQ